MMQKIITLDVNTGKTTEVTQDVNVGMAFLNNILRPAYRRMLEKGSRYTPIFYQNLVIEIWYDNLSLPNGKRMRRWTFRFGRTLNDDDRNDIKCKVLAAFRVWGSPKQEACWTVDSRNQPVFQVDEPDIIALV